MLLSRRYYMLSKFLVQVITNSTFLKEAKIKKKTIFSQVSIRKERIAINLGLQSTCHGIEILELVFS